MTRPSSLALGAIAFGLVATIVISVVAWQWAVNVAPWRYGDTLIGMVDGVISSADASSNVVRVASGLFGRTSVKLIVAPDTEIVVGEELGQFASLEAGSRLRAVYEVRPEGLIARYVEVLTGSADGATRLGVLKRPRDAVHSSATVEPRPTVSRPASVTADEAVAERPAMAVTPRRQRQSSLKRNTLGQVPPPIVEHVTPPSAEGRCPEPPCPTTSPAADSPPASPVGRSTSPVVRSTSPEPIGPPLPSSPPPVEADVVPPPRDVPRPAPAPDLGDRTSIHAPGTRIESP
jgi:hypothetical protein